MSRADDRFAQDPPPVSDAPPGVSPGGPNVPTCAGRGPTRFTRRPVYGRAHHRASLMGHGALRYIRRRGSVRSVRGLCPTACRGRASGDIIYISAGRGTSLMDSELSMGDETVPATPIAEAATRRARAINHPSLKDTAAAYLR